MLDLEFLSFVDLNKDKDKVELNAMSKNIVSRTNETMIRLAKRLKWKPFTPKKVLRTLALPAWQLQYGSTTGEHLDS